MHRNMPVNPRDYTRRNYHGSVWVKTLVGSDGNVICADVFRTSWYYQLDKSAVEAAMHDKYKPANQNGKSVAVWIAYEVKFEQ
jgi:TonB family protein